MKNQFCKSKAEHVQDFEDKTAAAPQLVRCACCDRLGSKQNLDRHHTQGRHGENLSKIIYL